jgi:hypothetical protein
MSEISEDTRRRLDQADANAEAHVRQKLKELADAAKERKQPDDLKRDAGKPDYTLLPLSAWALALSHDDLLGVVRVREWFVRNGGHRDSWKQVEGIRWRAAAERHRQAIHLGESLDPESGLPHRHHYLCNICFLLAKGIQS